MTDSFVGIWKLECVVHVNLGVCESSRPFGANPYGFLSFTADGTYLQTVVSQDELLGVLAETGTYRLLPVDRISLHRTCSSNPVHEVDAELEYQLEGDTLTIAASRIEQITGTEMLETFIWRRWPIRASTQAPRQVLVERSVSGG